MENMKKTIAIDMDGVIADVEAQFISWYLRDYGITITREDLQGRNEDNAFPEKGLIRKFARTPGFFLSAPVMEGAVEALKILMEDFEVYIVSARSEERRVGHECLITFSTRWSRYP